MDRWPCPSCGYSNSVGDNACKNCRTTRPAGFTKIYRREPEPTAPGGKAPPKPAAAPIALPCHIPDVRFMVEDQWTSGSLCAVAGGWFLLSEKDGLADAESAASMESPGVDHLMPIGSQSLYLPLAAIQKVAKASTPGYTLICGPTKIPLRLGPDGRARFAQLLAAQRLPQ